LPKRIGSISVSRAASRTLRTLPIFRAHRETTSPGAASRWRKATPGSPERATLEAWAEASFSESTIRAIGAAAAIPTAGAGGRRSVEWSSGGSRAATSAFGTKEAPRPNGSGRRTRRRNAGSPDPFSFLVGAHVKLVFRMVRRRSRPGAESAYEPLCQRERRSVGPGRLLPYACSGCRRHPYGGCCLRGGVSLDRVRSRDRPLSDRRTDLRRRPAGGENVHRQPRRTLRRDRIHGDRPIAEKSERGAAARLPLRFPS
jgi:hypothetical protein